MGADVSKNTVAILLVIVILLSIAGTWVALNVSQPSPVSTGGEPSAAGEVRVFVQPEPVKITGNVAVNIEGLI